MAGERRRSVPPGAVLTGVLTVALTAVALLANAGRLGDQLAGGALLPVPGLTAVWSDYLASWHAVGGGSTSLAPPTLAVLGVLGSIFSPVGGPSTAVAVLLFGDAPLAGLVAFLSTRRLSASWPVRAWVAAGYALLPTAMAAVGQGRLDVIIVHLLLPGVLAGTAAVADPAVRLSAACAAAIGLAVIGAFQPLTLLIVVLFALGWFVASTGALRRRAIALFVIVLLPLPLLMPWPAALVEQPALLARGVGVAVSSAPTGLAAGPLSQVVVLVAVVIAIVVTIGTGRRSPDRPVATLIRPLLPGLALAAAGAVTVVALVPFGYWPGAALIVLTTGLLWMLLAAAPRAVPAAASSAVSPTAPTRRTLAGLAVLAVLLFAVGDVIAGRSGQLRPDNDGLTLATPVAMELAATGRSVLVLAADGQPTRQSAGGPPTFGDDDLRPAPGARDRLASWDAGLRSTDPALARAAVAQAAMAGVLYVVLPDRATADRLRATVGSAVGMAPPTSGGRPVLRINLTGATATLLSPALAGRAVTGGVPPTAPDPVDVVPVDAAPPAVAARVSAGGDGRLLVVAADDEDGWQATVNGRPAPITRAWGHLVAVAVPIEASTVRIWLPSGGRAGFLLAQAALLLITAVAAIPAPRRRAHPRVRR